MSMQIKLIPVNNWKRDHVIGLGLCIRHGRGDWRTRWIFIGRGLRLIGFVGW